MNKNMMLFVALFCSFDWENNIWNRTKTVGCGTVPRAKKYVLQKRPSKFFFCFAFIISLHCSFIKNFYVASKSTILCLSNGTSCTKFRSLVFEYYNKTFYQLPVTHRLRNKNRRVLGGNKYLYALHTFDSKKNSITYFTKYIALMIDK